MEKSSEKGSGKKIAYQKIQRILSAKVLEEIRGISIAEGTAGVGKEKCGLLSNPNRGKEDIAARLAKRQCCPDPANIEAQEPPLSSSRSAEALLSEIWKSKACPLVCIRQDCSSACRRAACPPRCHELYKRRFLRYNTIGCHDEEQSYDRCLSAAFCPQPEAASRHDSLAAARTEEPLKKLRLREQSGGVPDGTGEYEREFLFCERAFLRSARRHLLTFAVQRRIWQPKQLMAANPAADSRPRRRDIWREASGHAGDVP